MVPLQCSKLNMLSRALKGGREMAKLLEAHKVPFDDATATGAFSTAIAEMESYIADTETELSFEGSSTTWAHLAEMYEACRQGAEDVRWALGELRVYADDLYTAQSELEERQEEVRDLENRVSELERHIDELEDENERLEERLEDQEEEYKEHRAEYRKELDELRAQLAQFTTPVAQEPAEVEQPELATA